jgi:hypothetical protein
MQAIHHSLGRHDTPEEASRTAHCKFSEDITRAHICAIAGQIGEKAKEEMLREYGFIDSSPRIQNTGFCTATSQRESTFERSNKSKRVKTRALGSIHATSNYLQHFRAFCSAGAYIGLAT